MMKISVYSLSASDKKVQEVIELAKKYQCDGIEWWCREKAHIDPTDLKNSAMNVSKMMDDSGLECAGLAPYFNFNETSDYIGRIFETACILKTRNVRCHSHIFDGNESVEELMKKQRTWLEKIVLPEAEKFDIRLNIEQHHYNICCTANACRQLVDGLPERHFGIIFDPGNSAVEGFTRPEYFISVCGKYLAHVHAKNCKQIEIREGAISGRKYKMEFGSLEEGDIDWVAIIKALQKANFQGFVSLEALDKRPSELKFQQDIVFLQNALKQI